MDQRCCLLVGALTLAVCASLTSAQTESFENRSIGAITAQKSGPLGTWIATEDAEISNRRAASGAQALRIFGGEGRRVTLRLSESHSSSLVSFMAERWTRRNPFTLTLEARIGDHWQTVFDDNGRHITIGGYHAKIVCQIDDSFTALRFTCTSPDGGGVLIDDLMIEPLRPMRVVSVTTEQPILPVLIGNEVNPIARVRIVTEGSLDPITVTSLRWDLSSSEDLADLARAAAYLGTTDKLAWRDPTKTLAPSDRLGSSVPAAASIVTSGSLKLSRGDNFIWLSVSLTDKADLDGWIDAGCNAVTLADGTTIVPETTHPDPIQRLGVSVRNAGDDGIPVFRIPGIITTNHGTLIAVYDIRHRGWGDLPGDIDVGMSRSIDGGRSWEPMQTVLDTGDDPAWRYDGVGDPSILYDPATDTIWVAAIWSHGDRSWNGSGPGLSPEQTGQFILTKSTDDGDTWSDPINITRQIKDLGWAFLLPSPGKGITMQNGTLVFPAQFRLSPEEGRVPYSTVITSSDHGVTWRIGSGARSNTTECTVVEVEPGTLMLNMRDNRGGSRAVAMSQDLGRTWTTHPTSRGALPGPVCNASLIRARAADTPARPWLVFMNPNVTTAPRRHMTLKLSTDGGMTWPHAHHLLLDEGISAGYPSITMLDDDTLGVFYEGSRAHMTFQRIPVADFAAGPSHD